MKIGMVCYQLFVDVDVVVFETSIRAKSVGGSTVLQDLLAHTPDLGRPGFHKHATETVDVQATLAVIAVFARL
jgi:hypothetical protein